MRIAFIVVAGMLVFLALWQGADAQEVTVQEEAVSPCWDVVHGPIGVVIMGPTLLEVPSHSPMAKMEVLSNQARQPETWEAILINRCTGATWSRSHSGMDWKPLVDRETRVRETLDSLEAPD